LNRGNARELRAIRQTRKRRFASDCVVGLEGLERPNRRL
jgi:hypothetical protein